MKMRENIGLFKGKRKDNLEWIEGYLYRLSETLNPFIMVKNKSESYEVIPETVSEYSGLQDKNKKLVYEGDILYDEYYENTCMVIFHKGCFCIHEDNISHRNWGCSMTGLEVIGNIHDNPELLERLK